MTIPLFQVDAFTNRPFAGNPAAVCLLESPAEADWMQAIAQEMNLSETAFLYPAVDGFHLRWFTPAVGVNEDPVTGSAHTSLTPYWSAILGKTSLSAFQASTRGGELRLRLNHDRVGISGQAVTVFSGQLQA